MSTSTTHRRTTAAVALALGGLGLSLAGAGAASAAGTTYVVGAGHDHRAGSVSIPLTQRATRELRDGHNFIAAKGAADKASRSGRVVLELPMRRSPSYPDHGRSAGSTPLAGSVAFTGAGPDVVWRSLRIDVGDHAITAVTGGSRQTILRVSPDRGGDRRGALRLTGAGARSLNRAADGTPFSAGQVFAKDSSGCS